MGLDFRDCYYRRYIILGKRTVKNGEAMLVWNRKGETKEVIGPALVYLYCSAIRFLSKFTAGPEEYLVVTKVDGRVEHVPGPASLFQNPTLHKDVAVKSAISLTSATECIVLHRQIPAPLIKTEAGLVTPSPLSSSGGQKIDRLFLHGPTLVFPGVGDSVLNFTWTSSLLSFEENTSFHILNTAQRQIKVKGVVSFRGENKIRGVVQLQLSVRIVDVARMVDSSQNLMSDLGDAIEVDLNHISLLAIETIQQVSDLDVFSTVNSFPQLISRAREVGVQVSHVLLGGFTPDETLRHHISDLASVHARYAKECIVNEQTQQKMAAELTARKERLAHEESYLAAETTMKQKQLAAEHHYRQSQLEHSLALQRQQEEFDLEVLRGRNMETVSSLQTLSELGVDLTQLLCSGNGTAGGLIDGLPGVDLASGGKEGVPGATVAGTKKQSAARTGHHCSPPSS